MIHLPRFALGLVLGAAVSVVAWSAAAIADNYGDGEGSAGLRPDGSLHTYCFASNFSGQNEEDGANYAFANLVEQTTMTKDKRPDCSGSTDVKFQSNQLNRDGRWICTDRSGNYCNAARIEMDNSHITSPNDWKQTACHETGHSVGLAHGDGSDCMGSAHDDPNDRRYDNHHVDHINQDRF